jgi:hypothetical protein
MKFMKLKTSWYLIAVITLPLVIGATGYVRSTFGDTPDAVLSMVKNDVQVKKAASEEWIKAELNMQLAEGDSVKTGKNSFATLKFSYPKDNCFQLYENTQVKVGELVKGEDKPLKSITMNMLKGGTWSKLKDVKDKDFSFKLNTPNTVAAISGTALATIVYDDKETYFCACDGFIDIGTLGKKVTIKRCQGTTVKGDNAPSSPVSDKYIITDTKYKGDPRFAWCIHCHSMMEKKCAPKQDEEKSVGLFPGCAGPQSKN